MSQSYLSLTLELRIRRYEDLIHGTPDHYDRTLKSEGTLAREEIIKDLTPDEYNILLEMTGGLPPIAKGHKTFDWQGYTLEYSVVDAERGGGFSYAEIEFPSVEEANAFVPPPWFGEETTEQQTFRMKTYWRDTRLNTSPMAGVGGVREAEAVP